jgi:nucleoid-associated protein YgaU
MVPLFGVEGKGQSTNFVNALLNNQYLLESRRLTSLAEGSFAQGDYDAAIAYAEEAMRYAEMSDKYVSLQMKIKQTQDAIAVAEVRLDWAASIDAPERYPQEYEQAQDAYQEACTARDEEHWDGAIAAAFRVMALLADLQELPTLPAQYLVRTWNPLKDCLWNIAGKPQIYGDPSKWRILYDANKEKLAMPDNPDLIHPGMILDIPSIDGEIRKGIWDENSSYTLLH